VKGRSNVRGECAAGPVGCGRRGGVVCGMRPPNGGGCGLGRRGYTLDVGDGHGARPLNGRRRGGV